MRRQAVSFIPLVIISSLTFAASAPVASTPVTSTPVTSAPVTATPAISGTSESFTTNADQDTVSWRDWIWDRPNMWPWATRTFIGYGVQRKNTSVIELLTTQPFWEKEQRFYFWQARGSYDYGELTGNFGLGYRFFNKEKTLLWGLNAFFDDATHFKFKRYGIGAELYHRIFVLRANYYQPVSSASNIYTSPTTDLSNYKRPLKGYDFSVEAPVPLFEWARIVGEGYRYLGYQRKNITGGGAYFRIYLAKALELDTGFISDNVNGNQTFAKVELYFGGPDFIEHALTSQDYTGTIAYLDPNKQKYQRVIRNNQVVIETNYGGQPKETEIKVHSW